MITLKGFAFSSLFVSSFVALLLIPVQVPDGIHWLYLSHVTDICVGYRLGEYRQGTVAVLEPGQVPTTSEKMKAIASNFQCYVGTSGYAPVDPVSQTGHWMWILVRTTSTGDVMVMPTFVSEEIGRAHV